MEDQSFDPDYDGTAMFANSSYAIPGFGPRFRRPEPDTTTAPVLLGVGGSLLFLALALLAVRIWSRMRPVFRLHWDDYTVLIATVLAITNYITIAVAVYHGLGRRARFVRFSRRKNALRLLFVSELCWYWSITFIKLSVAMLLLRLKQHTSPNRSARLWRIAMIGIMTLLLAVAILQTCFQFLQCRPFAVYWDPGVFFLRTKNGQSVLQCFPRALIDTNVVLFSAVQVAVDLVFSFIPITFISKLSRPRREKILLCVLMGLGLFASAAAIVRTLHLRVLHDQNQDFFRTNVRIAVWAVVEQQCGLVAATMPTLKAFVENLLVRLGCWFYDEQEETQVRDRLVRLGFLDRAEAEAGVKGAAKDVQKELNERALKELEKVGVEGKEIGKARKARKGKKDIKDPGSVLAGLV